MSSLARQISKDIDDSLSPGGRDSERSLAEDADDLLDVFSGTLAFGEHHRNASLNFGMFLVQDATTISDQPVCAVNCSDITNTRLGISGETAPVARISMFIVCTVLPPVMWWFKFTAGVSHHTPPPPGGAGLSQLIIF